MRGGATDDAAGIQIEDNGQIYPALTGPDIEYVASPFLIGAVRGEILI